MKRSPVKKSPKKKLQSDQAISAAQKLAQMTTRAVRYQQAQSTYNFKDSHNERLEITKKD